MTLRVISDETPVGCVVRALEELLVRAKRGEILGLVVAWEAKGTFGHALAIGKSATTMGIVGELHLAQFTALVEGGRIKPPGQ